MRKVMLCAAVAALLGVAAILVVRDEAVAEVPQPPQPPPLPDQHDPFTPWSMGPHEIAYEQLPDAEQAAVDQLAEWADTTHGPAVHAAWHAASVAHAARIQLELLERITAMDGLERLGVEP